MDRRRKTLLTIIVAGGLFVAWRATSLVKRVVPASASAGTATLNDALGSGETPTALGKPAYDDMTSRAQAQLTVEAQPWGRDPFDPAPFDLQQAAPKGPDDSKASKPPPAPSLTLSGVSRAGGRWLAAIDGGIVGVGDLVQEKYKVVRITKSSITLVSGGWAYSFDIGSREADIRPWTEEP
jgi:hypothetical protein